MPLFFPSLFPTHQHYNIQHLRVYPRIAAAKNPQKSPARQYPSPPRKGNKEGKKEKQEKEQGKRNTKDTQTKARGQKKKKTRRGHTDKDIQTYRHTDIQTSRRTDIQTNRQADGRTGQKEQKPPTHTHTQSDGQGNRKQPPHDPSRGTRQTPPLRRAGACPDLPHLTGPGPNRKGPSTCNQHPRQARPTPPHHPAPHPAHRPPTPAPQTAPHHPPTSPRTTPPPTHP